MDLEDDYVRLKESDWEGHYIWRIKMGEVMKGGGGQTNDVIGHMTE